MRADSVVRPYIRRESLGGTLRLFLQQPVEIGDGFAVEIAVFPHELLDFRDIIRPACGGEGNACGARHVVAGLQIVDDKKLLRLKAAP